jgi:Chaperone of endosialidase
MKTMPVLPPWNLNPATALLAAILISGFSLQPSAFSQPTTFTYQGRLDAGGQPTTGNYDLRFTLYDAITAGNTVGSAVNAFATPVTNGLFVALLDFGPGAFDGNLRFLEMAIRPTGSTNAFITLAPRQFVSSAPYAMQAGTASMLRGILADTQLSPNVARLNGSNVFTGPVSFSPASGAGFTVSSTKKIANLNADLLDGLDSTAFWKTGGNLGTGPSTNFLGTLDNSPLQLRVNNQPLMTLQPNGAVGIGTTNPGASLDVDGWVRVRDSGPPSPSSTGLELGVSNPYSQYAGYSWIQSHDYPLVLNPLGNSVGIGTAIPAAQLEVVTSNRKVGINWPNGATPWGGILTVSRPDDGSPVGFLGGAATTTNGGLDDMVLYAQGGGVEMRLASQDQGFGFYKVPDVDTAFGPVRPAPLMKITGSGNVGIGTAVPQNILDIQGDNAFVRVAGRSNNDKVGFSMYHVVDATNDQIWSFEMQGSSPRPGSAQDDLIVGDGGGNNYITVKSRAGAVLLKPNGGNVGIGTTSPQATLDVNGDVAVDGGHELQLLSTDNSVASRIKNPATGTREISFVTGAPLAEAMRIVQSGNVGIGTNSPRATLEVAGDAIFDRPVAIGLVNAQEMLDVAGNVRCLSVIQTSDRNAKKNFAAVSSREVLDHVAELPIQTWNFTNDTSGARHIGPMAQDFYAAFGVGPDDKHIATVDADGVALAAIQGLNQKVDGEVATLKKALKRRDAENTELRKRVERLESILSQQIGDTK